MDDSILLTIRKLVCGDAYANHFDDDLLVHINACFAILNQLGVGDVSDFVVTNEHQTWDDYTKNVEDLGMVRTYVTQKVKLIFDPPLTNSVLDAMKAQIAELEWRLSK